MIKFEVYYRALSDSRAPEHVDLPKDYKFVGIVVGRNIRDIEYQLAKPDSTLKITGGARKINVGDVLVELPSRIPRIYTWTGAWALVKLIQN